jgi:hypothetical protein
MATHNGAWQDAYAQKEVWAEAKAILEEYCQKVFGKKLDEIEVADVVGDGLGSLVIKDS